MMAPQMVEEHRNLHSFCIYPKVRFETQAPNEQVILTLRAHPITLLPWIFNTLIFIIILIALNFFLQSFFAVRQIIFANIFMAAVIFNYVWFNFLSWFFNVGIVTNKRIIDVDFHSVIYKEVTEARLNKVEDITSKSGGFLASFIHYGNLFIQTAGQEANIEFMNIPMPTEAVKIITDLVS